MPVDRCNVFFYPRKETTPLLAGELRLLPGMKGSVFRYARDFIANPNAIALDPFSLPLQPAEMVTLRDGDALIPDAFSDAGPDLWGRAVIDRVARLVRQCLARPLQFHQRWIGSGRSVPRLSAQSCTAW